MRALLAGKNAEKIRHLAEETGFHIVQSAEADLCICYGGDGTLLGAEREFPGLPKLPIRKRREMAGQELEAYYLRILDRVKSGQAVPTHLPKLEAVHNGERLLAVNDIILHNARVTSAVRYNVAIDGVEHFGEIVGDGLVVATPFGSSAYYRSITNSVIHVGMGLAFNNSTEPVNHLVLHEDSSITTTISRGPGLLAADNNPRELPLAEGDEVIIRMAEETATILEIDNLLAMDRNSTYCGRRLRWIKPLTQKLRRENGNGNRNA